MIRISDCQICNLPAKLIMVLGVAASGSCIRSKSKSLCEDRSLQSKVKVVGLKKVLLLLLLLPGQVGSSAREEEG